jgi:ATP-dependent protease ClpP protease subunit
MVRFQPNPLLCVVGLVGVLLSCQVARTEPGRVGGRIDCESKYSCMATDLEVVGEINASTAEAIKRLFEENAERAVREKKDASSALQMVSLNSLGGSVTAAMDIGRILRKERLLATVPQSGVCYSACVLIFAGAVERLKFGKVGIHRPYLDVPQQEVSSRNVNEPYQRMLQDIRSYFHEMNVSEQMADAMLRIEPDKIRLLNDNDLNTYGLTGTDPIEQETEDLQDAQYWGIANRREYIRRKALTETSCPGRVGVPDIHSQCYQAVMKTGRLPAQSPSQGTPDFSQFGTQR